ncbi:MAG: hypothetical protein COB69_03800 [Phycisphaera sp.]|nr:MAG: hypothetical protein COB69_03800 [Phycisphaera sp.]
MADDVVDIEIDPGKKTWRELWQVPTLALAVVLLLAGLIGVVATRPKPDINGMIRIAETRLERGDHAGTLEMLNGKVRQHVDAPFFTDAHLQQFHTLRGRAVAKGQRELGVQETQNYESVLSEFKAAEKAGAKLGNEDQLLRLESLIATEQYDEATDRLERLDDELSAERIALRKRIIEVAMGARHPRIELAESHLLTLTRDPMLGVDDRCWAAARRAEIQLDQGFINEAITGILREMPRVASAKAGARGELFTLLGRGYMESGAVSEARKQLERATELIDSDDDLFAQTLMQLGRSLELTGEMELALEQFELVTQDYAGSKSYLPAMLARGDVLSAISETDPAQYSKEESIGAYVRFVDEAVGRAPEPLLLEAIKSMLQRSEEQFVKNDLVAASQYVQLAEDIHGILDTPVEVLHMQARVNFAMAEEMLRGAITGEAHVIDLADADPVTRAQTQRHYIRAADYYRRLADRIAGTDDDAAYAHSLWMAADAFDRGGDVAEAIAGFSEFAISITDDPRVPEAQFRLARAYQASGDYSLAAQQFEGLLTDSHDERLGKNVGPFAVLSHVPLAQVYLADIDSDNDSRAEELLNIVIRGELGDVNSDAFAMALASIGQVHYLKGQYPRAIESLTEAVARNPGTRDIHRLRFLLADSRRLEAEMITQTLTQGSIAPSVARELIGKQTEHLTIAAGLFADVRDGLEEVDPRRRTALETMYLRNSYFYVGDCAFDLGEFETAIRSYSIAKDRYAEDAASLIAMVQIFNSYFELGDLERARTASERARRFYETLPKEAWEDKSLPMTQADWERWLDSSYELAAMRTDGLGG